MIGLYLVEWSFIKFILTAGIGEKLGSSLKPTVADGVLENQARDLE